jgi:hypothetical protein
MKIKTLAAISAAVVIITMPAYRYYVIGAIVANRILEDRAPYRTIPRGSKLYKRLMGV